VAGLSTKSVDKFVDQDARTELSAPPARAFFISSKSRANIHVLLINEIYGTLQQECGFAVPAGRAVALFGCCRIFDPVDP
jgi:hypothetical protein